MNSFWIYWIVLAAFLIGRWIGIYQMKKAFREWAKDVRQRKKK